MKHLLTLSALLAVTLELFAQWEYYDSSDDIYNLVVETETVVLDNCTSTDLNAGEVFVHRFYVESESPTERLGAVFGENLPDFMFPLTIEATGGVWNHPEGSAVYNGFDLELLQSFPCLEYDSYMMINYGPTQTVLTTDNIDFFDTSTIGQPEEFAFNDMGESGMWFALAESPNTMPDESGRWQILQITSSQHLTGVLNYQILEFFENDYEQTLITKQFDTQPFCSDESACNFVANAVNGEGVCDYSCCPGPGCCGEGTTWDSASQTCLTTYLHDADFDGCVGMTDLLDLLSVFGTCLEE